MVFLNRRDHSEQELRTKLARKHSPEDIDAAIEQAREEKWLADPEDLAQRYSESLHNKGKGALKIQAELKKKGLPSVPIDTDRELSKAEELVSRLCGKTHELSQIEKAKTFRKLYSRGYTTDIIFKAIQHFEEGALTRSDTDR